MVEKGRSNMKASSNTHLRRTLLCALALGCIAAPFATPHAYALPIEGANAATNAGEANISTGGAVMDIVGKTEHNILKWEDFSIEQNEKVRFDGGSQTRDYLNLVTGEGASNIYGTIEGGRNVYLVNPHGILFAKGSEVNTGALYLSTANPADIAAATNTFKADGTSPLSATAQTGNVLNLGTVKAAKLYIEGKKVTVLNTDAVTDANGTALTGANVTIRGAETPHIGYDVGNTATANFNEGGGSVPHSFYDYAHPNTAKSASGRGWDVKNLGGTAHTDYDYMRVHTVYDLQNINANRDGRYILAGDIDATATQDWNSGAGFLPIGESYTTNFTGRFDGVGHTITGLYIRRTGDFRGLFGYASGARIENLSLVDGDVEGNHVVGGIVGYAENTVIRNVSYAGRVNGVQNVGGIVGWIGSGTLQNAWNAGAVTGRSSSAGGIVGYAENAVIRNVSYAGRVNGVRNVGGIVGNTWRSTLQNAWNTGTVTGSMNVGGIVGVADGGTVRHAVSKTGSAGQAVGASINGADVTTDVKVAAEADMKLAATYTDWKDAHGNAIVATDGGKGTPWRIYDGKTTPMLTALMKGTKRLEKVYDGNVFATTDTHITLVNTGKDVGTYNAYSDQFGYDLIGGAVIKPKALTLDLVNGTRFDKTYDGSDSVTQTLTKGTNYSLDGFVTGEGAGIELAAVTGKYADKNAAADKAVTFDGLTLTGTGAGNYVTDKTALTGTGTIAQRALTLGAIAAQSKTYDGTTAEDASKFHAALAGMVAGDSVTATASGAVYNDKGVATANTVGYTGVALAGADAANYTLAATTAQGTGTITPRALTLGTVAEQSKTYDGTTAADTSKFHAALNNAVAGDSVTATAAGAVYNDHNVAAANAVSYTGVALTGADVGNYTLTATTAQGAGRITPKQLSLALANGVRFDKTYDGSDSVTQELAKGTNYTLTGFIGTEGNNLELASATGAYTAGKDAGTDKEVTFKNLTLTGTGAGNYVLNRTSLAGIGTIARRALTLGAVAAQSKTYDGNTLADTSKFGAVLNNVVAGEENSVKATATGATYNSKDVATANTVSYTGVALAGAEAGNYTLAATTVQGAGTITARALTLGTVAAQTKTYDGNTNADAAQFSATLGNKQRVGDRCGRDVQRQERRWGK